MENEYGKGLLAFSLPLNENQSVEKEIFVG
jgi:hypothetical protein